MRLTRRTVLLGLVLAVGLAPAAAAWPPKVAEAIARDARRLLPSSLASALAAREDSVRASMEGLFVAGAPHANGRLGEHTLVFVNGEIDGALEQLRNRHVSDGLVRLGGLARLPIDLSDPAAGVDEMTLPGRVRDEYYLFVQANLSRIPVVVSDPKALELTRAELPAFWQRLLDESRRQTGLLRTEMVREGRIVSYRTIDFRSPVFGVASLSYSRAVTGVAATWLALWREVAGDLTRRPKPVEIKPQASPPAVAPARRPNLEGTRP